MLPTIIPNATIMPIFTRFSSRKCFTLLIILLWVKQKPQLNRYKSQQNTTKYDVITRFDEIQIWLRQIVIMGLDMATIVLVYENTSDDMSTCVMWCLKITGFWSILWRYAMGTCNFHVNIDDWNWFCCENKGRAYIMQPVQRVPGIS